MSKIHIDDQIIEAKRLVNNDWPNIAGEQKEIAKAIVTTLQWIRDNADTIRLTAKVSKQPNLLDFVKNALKTKEAFPGSEFEPAPEGTEID